MPKLQPVRITFLLLEYNAQHLHLRGGVTYFGSHFQSLVIWLQCRNPVAEGHCWGRGAQYLADKKQREKGGRHPFQGYALSDSFQSPIFEHYVQLLNSSLEESNYEFSTLVIQSPSMHMRLGGGNTLDLNHSTTLNWLSPRCLGLLDHFCIHHLDSVRSCYNCMVDHTTANQTYLQAIATEWKVGGIFRSM